MILKNINIFATSIITSLIVFLIVCWFPVIGPYYHEVRKIESNETYLKHTFVHNIHTECNNKTVIVNTGKTIHNCDIKIKIDNLKYNLENEVVYEFKSITKIFDSIMYFVLIPSLLIMIILSYTHKINIKDFNDKKLIILLSGNIIFKILLMICIIIFEDFQTNNFETRFGNEMINLIKTHVNNFISKCILILLSLIIIELITLLFIIFKTLKSKKVEEIELVGLERKILTKEFNENILDF